MATLTATQIDRNGATQSLASAAAGGDEFANTGDEIFVVANGNGADPRTVTFAIEKEVDGVTPSGKAVTVAASATMFIGPFPTEIYNDVDGKVQVTYSDSAADLTVQVLRC
jgi:hypothetical protein